MQGLYIYYIKFIYKVHNGTKARKKVGQNKPGLVGIHGICECKGAGMNKAACGVYATLVSFRAGSWAGEAARRRRVGYTPPPHCFLVLFARERG